MTNRKSVRSFPGWWPGRGRAVTDDSTGAAVPPQPRPWLTDADEFLGRYHLLVAVTIVLAGLAVRVAAALPGYLNPDEILHVLIAGDTTFAAAQQHIDQARSPHPFLHVLVIYLLNLLHASDFVLRLPSVIAGALVPWFGYLWMRRAAGPAAGLGTAALLAFLPETIRLSTEVREYALMLLFIVAALYLLELGLDEKRAGPVLASGGLMLLSLATVYATMWVAPALAVLGLLRLISGRASRRLWLAWAAVQLAFAAGLTFAWFSQISSLMTDKLSTATDGWLRDSFFRRGIDHVLLYPFQQTAIVFRYLFSGSVTGWVGIVAVSAGIVLSALRRRWALAVLLALPFVTNCAASYLGFYPFGGTRHVFHLVLFSAGAVGLLASEPLFRRPLPVLGAVALLLAVANIWPSWPLPSFDPRDQRRELMTGAVGYLKGQVRWGGSVFCDHQSGIILRYYLGGERALGANNESLGFVDQGAGSYRTVWPSIGRVYWTFTAANFSREFARYIRSRGIGLDREVWVFDAGWGYNLAPDLEWNYGVQLPGALKLGRAISVFPMNGRRLPGSDWAAAALESLANEASPLWGGRVRTVLWPSDHDTCGPACAAAARLAPDVITYRQLQREAGQGVGGLKDHLPALAFWVLRNTEPRAQLLRGMDDQKDYTSDSCRFTLVALDADTIAAVYLVESLKPAQ